jgi:hypothetical protein
MSQYGLSTDDSFRPKLEAPARLVRRGYGLIGIRNHEAIGLNRADNHA